MTHQTLRAQSARNYGKQIQGGIDLGEEVNSQMRILWNVIRIQQADVRRYKRDGYKVLAGITEEYIESRKVVLRHLCAIRRAGRMGRESWA